MSRADEDRNCPDISLERFVNLKKIEDNSRCNAYMAYATSGGFMHPRGGPSQAYITHDGVSVALYIEHHPTYSRDSLVRSRQKMNLGLVSSMNRLLLLLLSPLFVIIDAIPTLPNRKPIVGAIRPTCFPTRPYCIRPRVQECRDTIFLMGSTGPEYPVIFGRDDVIKDIPRAYGLPRKWAAMPDNCVVKVDVYDPQATDEATMKMLAAGAELVVRWCILEGTGCGGSILSGRAKALEVSLGYYTALDFEDSHMHTRPNVSYNIYADA